jgi:hypothetical protein
VAVNLFILDSDPVKAAQLQCDKHVVKMIVESAQMLSTVHRMLDGVETRVPSKSGKTMSKAWTLPDEREDTFYRAVHMHHPCTIWTAQSNNNYTWHWVHFAALCAEYTYRYGKVHSTDTLLREALKQLPRNIPVKSDSRWHGQNVQCLNGLLSQPNTINISNKSLQ